MPSNAKAPQGTRRSVGGTIGGLLDAYVEVMDALTENEMIRSGNQPTGDLAESVARELFQDSKPAPRSNRAWDLQTKDGRTVQVKARRNLPSSRNFSYTSEGAHADIYLFMIFSADFRTIEFAYEIDHATMELLASKPLGGAARPGARSVSVNRLSKCTEGVDWTDDAKAVFEHMRNEPLKGGA